MDFGWLTWSNPVAIWWAFLVIVSALNISLWGTLYRASSRQAHETHPHLRKAMLLLCAAYVFGCAFRSILPRADVARICLFDTWLSNVLIGRSVATIAEVCFAVQWAIVLHRITRLTKSRTALALSAAVIPLIAVAECSSWYAVITTSYLGNTVENSIWAMTFSLIAAALALLLKKFGGVVRIGITLSIAGVALYVAFLLAVDIPMYFGRWQADLTAGKPLFDLFAGLHDLRTRWVVTRDYADWKDEILWMSLYFSAAVWSSLGLCIVNLAFQLVSQHRVDLAVPGQPDNRLKPSTRTTG